MFAPIKWKALRSPIFYAYCCLPFYNIFHCSINSQHNFPLCLFIIITIALYTITSYCYFFWFIIVAGFVRVKNHTSIFFFFVMLFTSPRFNVYATAIELKCLLFSMTKKSQRHTSVHCIIFFKY